MSIPRTTTWHNHPRNNDFPYYCEGTTLNSPFLTTYLNKPGPNRCFLASIVRLCRPEGREGH